MATAIAMPKLGLSMKIGTVGKWLKNEGDAIKSGEPVVEVMTEKITNKVEAPADGILLKIVAPKGTKLPIGGLMGVNGEAGEDISALLAEAPAAEGDKAPAAAGGKVKISPVARKLAEEQGIDYTRIAGTGPQGRITKEDVEKAIEEGIAPADDRPTLEVIPYEGMRKAIGDNMAQSWAVAPKVTHHISVDMTELLALRQKVNEARKRPGIDTDFLVKAVARALDQT